VVGSGIWDLDVDYDLRGERVSSFHNFHVIEMFSLGGLINKILFLNYMHLK
jgi:hypothetical protein